MIRVILFGSTGMIGQGVLLECIDDPQVESILLVNRKSSSVKHPKVKEIIHTNFNDFSSLAGEFSNYNSCFFCLGITSVGMKEEDYTKITYDITLSAADAILKTGKDFTFCYISGKSTDSTEKGNSMWARVKGKTENALLAKPFKQVYMVRPGYIQPMRGIRSKTGWYNTFYTIAKPLYFLLKPMKSVVTDTTTLAKCMIRLATKGYDKKMVESEDINSLGRS